MLTLAILVGPVAKMDREKVRAFDDHSADLSCTVKVGVRLGVAAARA